MQYYAKILWNTILCNCIFSKYTLHFAVVVCVCWGVGGAAYSLGGFCPFCPRDIYLGGGLIAQGAFVLRGVLSRGLISQLAYSLGGFCPKGGFVQGAYISGGL